MTNATPANPHVGVRDDWLAKSVEDVLDASFPLTDPHHHLWTREYYPYLAPAFLADLQSGHRVRQTVFIESHGMYRQDGPPHLAPVGETEYADGVAKTPFETPQGPVRICAGIVGHADLTLGARAEEVMQAHCEASPDHFRGIRHITAWHAGDVIKGTFQSPPEGLMLDATFRAGFACLGRFGLSFDAWLFHTQLDELYDLARAYPDTAVVIDHVGGVLGLGPYADQRADVFAVWRAAIGRLAQLPNTFIKLSGLGMRTAGFAFENGALPPTSVQLAKTVEPYFSACIDAFGPRRCMFASNFPVDKGAYGYRVAWNAYKRIAARYSDDEKHALLHGTADAVYRLQAAS
jgi:L-fuconolactonase